MNEKTRLFSKSDTRTHTHTQIHVTHTVQYTLVSIGENDQTTTYSKMGSTDSPHPTHFTHTHSHQQLQHELNLKTRGNSASTNINVRSMGCSQQVEIDTVARLLLSHHKEEEPWDHLPIHCFSRPEDIKTRASGITLPSSKNKWVYTNKDERKKEWKM